MSSNQHVIDKKLSSSIRWKIPVYIILIIISVFCILPFYLMIINATRTTNEILTKLTLAPGSQAITNILRVLEYIPLPTGFKNSVIVSVSFTVLSVYIGSLTAYGFSKFKFKGDHILFWLMLSTMMLPAQITIIGYFKLMRYLSLVDQLPSLILPGLINSSMIFWIKQYCDVSVPNELIESARVDGCGELKIFHRIVFPILIPAVACLSIFVFISSWNEFMRPIILLFSPSKFTLPILTVSLMGFYSRDYAASYAGVAIAVIPITIVYAILSKYVINGLTLGAVKQ